MDDAENQRDEDCNKFRRWLLARRDLIWHLPTGSHFERPMSLIGADLTDIDYLIVPADVCAIPRGETVPSSFGLRPKVLTIYTNDVHAGFAKLIIDNRLNDNQFYERPNLDQIEESNDESFEKKPHGPAIMKTFKSLMDENAMHFLDSISPDDSSWKQMTQLKMDEVQAISCPHWPPEAAEWVTRKRDNNWPSRRDIKKVVKGGCHFVAKPHQSNPNDVTQWRFSFSQAEIILMHSWTDVQKHIYHLLRLVKSEVVKRCGGEDSTVLCSYYFKTLMFWACEKKPREFWEEMNLETSLTELIAMMVEWLVDRQCPNYFIRLNNMIDYLSDDIDFSKETEFLLIQRENCVRLLWDKPPKVSLDKTPVIFSNKFILYIFLGLHFNNVIDPLHPNMSTRISKYLTSSEELLSNIRELHLGISKHLEMMLPREICDSNLASIALELLEKAMECNSFGNTEVSLSDSFYEISRKLTTRQNSIRINSRIAENVVESDVQDNSTSTISRFLSATMMRGIDYYLPTPLFVVAASYRANFLFTGRMDYEAAIKACNEGRNLRREDRPLFSGDTFSFYTLPFIIMSEWSAIFDEQIQIVFGFVSLYQKIFKNILFGTHFHACEDEHSVVYPPVVFRLCAEDFLDYIRCRCRRRLGYENEPLKRPLANCLKISPLFAQMHFREDSAVFLCAAAHIGENSDLNSNEYDIVYSR